MTAETPDWDHDDPLEVYAPPRDVYARAGELWDYTLAVDHPKFFEAFKTACDAVLLERNLPQFLAAVLLHGRAVVEGNCTDPGLAKRRVRYDVSSTREDLIKEQMIHDDDTD